MNPRVLLLGDDIGGWKMATTLALAEYDIECFVPPDKQFLSEQMSANGIAVMEADAVLVYIGPGKVPMEEAIALASARLARTPVFLVDNWRGAGVEYLRVISVITLDTIAKAESYIIKHGV